MEEKMKVDLNRADLDTLAELPGIGPSLAARIIEYREQVQSFTSVMDLPAVSGISARKARQLEDWVTVGEEEPAVAAPSEETEEAGLVIASADLAEDEAPDAVSDEEMAEPDSAEEKEPAESPREIVAAEEAVEEEAAESEEPPADGLEPLPAAALASLSPMTSPAALASTAALTSDLDEAEADEEVGSPEIDEGEETAETEETATAAPRRGVSAWTVLAGSLLGALLGAAGALGLLWYINGTLFFATAGQAYQLETRLEATHADSLDLADGLGALATRLTTLSGRINNLSDQQQETGQALDETQEEVLLLQEKATELEDRLQDVAEAADTFSAFLNGLRDLLLDIQGMPAEAIETPDAPDEVEVEEVDEPVEVDPTEATPTPTLSPTPDAELTVTPTPTPGVQPTRTPRPTATPLR